MFSNTLDTVRTSEEEKIFAEAYLYKALLNGNHPTFSLNQIVDNHTLFEIAENEKKKGEEFLKMFQKGYFRVALFGNNRDVESYFTSLVQGCVAQEGDGFRFSGLPFLYGERYSKEQRKAVFEAMLEYLTQRNVILVSDNSRNILRGEDGDEIFHYMEFVRKINTLLSGTYVQQSASDKTLHESIRQKLDLMLEYGQERGNEIRNACLFLRQHTQGDSRSAYYKLIEQAAASGNYDFGEYAAGKLKTIVDAAYNEVVAASMDDAEMAQINYEQENRDIAECEAKQKYVKAAKETLSLDDDKKAVNWENMREFMEEIYRLKNEQQITWEQAREKNRRELTKKGILFGAGKAGLYGVNFVISVAVAELLGGLAGGLAPAASLAIDLGSGLLADRATKKAEEKLELFDDRVIARAKNVKKLDKFDKITNITIQKDI